MFSMTKNSFDDLTTGIANPPADSCCFANCDPCSGRLMPVALAQCLTMRAKLLSIDVHVSMAPDDVVSLHTVPVFLVLNLLVRRKILSEGIT